MKIIKINPQGFCSGVVQAIKIVEETLKNNDIKKPIYMLGNIVHNKNVVENFKNKGIIILEGESREKMLATISSGTIIITAHGASDNVKNIALKRGLNIIDATCNNVNQTHHLIKEKIRDDYTIYYYGKKGHPETEGVLGISPNIILITDKTNYNEIPIKNNKAFFTNQTTMSFFDVYKVYESLKIRIPNLVLSEEVCNATRKRQEAVISYKNKIDLCIVVGDVLSNNTRKLKDIALENNMQAILVESAEQLSSFNLSKFKIIGVTAGASTPSYIVNEIILFLKGKGYTL